MELADTIDLGSIPKGCRFKSCKPHNLDVSGGTAVIPAGLLSRRILLF